MRPGARLGEARRHSLAAALGDAPELLHVEMQQVAGGVVLVADRLPGDAVQAVEPVEAAAPQHGVDRGAGDPERHWMRCGPNPCVRRTAQMRRSSSGGVRRGCARGAELRSSSPAAPSARKRPSHLATVWRETRKWRATSAWGQPASTSRTSSSRVSGVSRALRLAMRVSSPRYCRAVTHSSGRGPSSCQQPTWELQLAGLPPAAFRWQRSAGGVRCTSGLPPPRSSVGFRATDGRARGLGAPSSDGPSG